RKRRPHAAVQGRGARNGSSRPLAWRGGDVPGSGGRRRARRGGDRAGCARGADPGRCEKVDRVSFFVGSLGKRRGLRYPKSVEARRGCFPRDHYFESSTIICFGSPILTRLF